MSIKQTAVSETSTATSTATSTPTTGSSSAGEASTSITTQSSSSAVKTEVDTKPAAPDRKPSINTGGGLLAEAGPISAVLMGGLTGLLAAVRLRKRK